MDSLHDPWDETMPVVPAADLTRLAALLCEREYSQHAREYVLAYARDLGTLEGLEELGDLDPADRADADAALEAAWPPVASTSHAWDEDRRHGRPSRWTIAGGLVPPDLEPEFEPTEEDLRDYAEWSATLPESYPMTDLEPSRS